MINIPRNEHPRPDRMRADWLCLNGTWDFEIDNAKKMQRIVGVYEKYKKAGGEITQELRDNLLFYQM